MSEYKRPTTSTEFEQNFEQIHPLMNETEAALESARCLFCYDAPCVNACPTSIDIPLFIRQINTGDLKGSAKTIYSANHLGNSCGKVCPTEVLCEGACVYTHQDVKPIEIGRLQNFATDKIIEDNTKLFNLAASNGKKVAVIGAGPGGVSCACELSLLGYQVTIFEAKSKPSGLVYYGVAPYKITNKESIDEITYLQNQFGFEIKYNQEISNTEKLTELESSYDAIYLGIGLGITNSINLKGEDLSQCFGATEFIKQLKTDFANTIIGKKIIVLGGGNTAMDAASESARMGAESVILAYRRSADEMGAYAFEYDLAKGVGVKGMFNMSPIEIYGNDKVEGVRFNQNESEVEISCDMVIRATGQSKQIDFLSLINDISINEKGIIQTDESGRSGNSKYFAGGDAVNGGAEVVNAVHDGKVAAHGIDEFLK
jgi:glutamate synthase (NADPH/NADH) small chain